MSADHNPCRNWMLAVRPRTLPAAMAPVAVGSALARADHAFHLLPALGALAGALLLQIAVNLANDYFDFKSGVDTAERLGPVRVTQSGLIAPGAVRAAMLMTLGAAGLIGIFLVYVGGWPIALIGAASVAGVLGYSGGPYPLASHGLGDLCVFVFFGPAAVVGTHYVQALSFSEAALIMSLPPGFLITAVLVVNNLRDIETDRAAGKRTLAVMIGPAATRGEYALLVGLAYLVPLVALPTGQHPVFILLPWLSLPLALSCIRLIYTARGRELNAGLGRTALLALMFSLLLAAGLAMG
ncbi:MAG: 1,4-dihydroxy-2-naphthoate polyprenyltransferase [Desulfobacterales bacterium]|nr:1,4-dihydroxy-2-naphthoate polyprenyltransferase [Desulfobacterales bacterium]